MTDAQNHEVRTQRAASLMNLPQVLQEFGVETADVLANSGITADQLRPNSFIPYQAYLTVLSNAARLTGRDDFGLILGRRQTLTALGPLGRVMRHAPTLGDAIATFATFQFGNSTGGTVYIMREDRHGILGYGTNEPAIATCPQIFDMVVAVGWSLVADLTDGAVWPEEVFSSRPQPRNMEPYRAFGQVKIRFAQDRTGLVFSPTSLRFRLPAADRQLHQTALSDLGWQLSDARKNAAGMVRHALRQLLPDGKTGMAEVAEYLSIHPRTLRRRLADQSTTFERVREDLRYAIARDLLSIQALSVTDISQTLGFATASSFVHFFQRWTGQSPNRWRLGLPI